MKREVMEHAGLTAFAEIGIVLFLVAFFLILVRVFIMRKDQADEMANIPLEDGSLEHRSHADELDGSEVSI